MSEVAHRVRPDERSGFAPLCESNFAETWQIVRICTLLASCQRHQVQLSATTNFTE